MQNIVRVGLLGTGVGRYLHLPGYKNAQNVVVKAIYSKNSLEAKSVADVFGIPAIYTSWKKLIDKSDIDLVDIALPPFLHYPAAMAAIERGCHILCEKPMAVNLEQAKNMLLAAEKRPVIHMINHQLRFNNKYNLVKSIIDEGQIGKIFHVRWSNISNYRSNSEKPWDWWSDEKAGGGNLLTSASHVVDTMRWMFGEIKAVSGQLGTWIKKRPVISGARKMVTSDDQYCILLETETGVLISNFVSAMGQHDLGNNIEIIGSEGTLILDNQGEIVLGRKGETMRVLRNNNLINKDDWTESFVGLVDELAGAIIENRPLVSGSTFRDGFCTQKVLDSIKRSWKERRWIFIE